VFWWTPGPPCLGCYVPFFVHGGALPPLVTQAGTAGKQVMAPHEAPIDTWAPGSYWWMFRALTDAVKGDPVASLPGYYAARSRPVRERFDRLEREFASELPAVLRRYVDSGDAQILGDFSAGCVERVAAALGDLLGELEDR
jgi:secernin